MVIAKDILLNKLQDHSFWEFGTSLNVCICLYTLAFDIMSSLNNHEGAKIIKIRYKHRLFYASPVPKIVPLSCTQAKLCLKHKLLEDQVKKGSIIKPMYNKFNDFI